jgi:hypothetical protein
MLAEAGSAYHVNAPVASTQLQMQQAWWQACITNQTFLNTYPRLKVRRACFSPDLGRMTDRPVGHAHRVDDHAVRVRKSRIRRWDNGLA